jgi:hypothetical protein
MSDRELRRLEVPNLLSRLRMAGAALAGNGVIRSTNGIGDSWVAASRWTWAATSHCHAGTRAQLIFCQTAQRACELAHTTCIL